MNTGERALLSLLAEYSRQFQEAIHEAQGELVLLVEPVKVRSWKADTGIRIFPPNEKTPEELWEWVEVRGMHPSLIEIQNVLNRFDEFVGQCENAASQERGER